MIHKLSNILGREIVFQSKRTFVSRVPAFLEGENALLRPSDPKKQSYIFIQNLQCGKILNTRWGDISHDDLVGKSVRDVLFSHRGAKFRIHRPTLEEYVLYAPRCVTPIYPDAANIIISLLDLHVSPPANSKKFVPIEILEAGTGNGSLTLYLARAIHGANPALPSENPAEITLAIKPGLDDQTPKSACTPEYPVSSSQASNTSSTSSLTVVDSWKTERQAIIHTVELAPHVSDFGRKHVSGFRQGMYSGNVDFHTANLSTWIEQQVFARTAVGLPPGNPFISHAILDLPGAHDHLEAVASVVHTDGIVLVFTTHITQLLSCLELSRKLRLPLILQRAIEIGPGVTGGRDWELGFTKKRKDVYRESKSEAEMLESSISDTSESVLNTGSLSSVQKADMPLENLDGGEATAARMEDEQQDLHTDTRPMAKNEELFAICRPKVVKDFMVGGFVGVFRKLAPSRRTTS